MKQNNIILQASKLSQKQREMNADQIKERIKLYQDTKDGTAKEPILSKTTHEAMTPKQCQARIRLLEQKLKELETSQQANTSQTSPNNTQGQQKQDSNLTSFITMLKNSGWKKTKNKKGKSRLQKDFNNYRIILSGPDISQLSLSFQSRSYSSKFTEFVANIICERTEAIEVTLMILTKATEDKKSKLLKKFDLTLSLATTEEKLNNKIKKYIKSIKNTNTKKVSAQSPKNNVKAEEKNQPKKQLSKDEMNEMIDSILDKLSDEQYDILAKRYKILNMD